MGPFNKKSFNKKSFNKKPPEEHLWLSDGEPVGTNRVLAVPLTRNLDAGYLALFDGDFAEVHRWPSDLFRFVKRTLGANDRIRSSYSRYVAAAVLADSPDQVVGLVSVERAHPDIPGPYFIRVHVAQDHRRTGVMSELLPEVIATIKQTDLENVVIATSKDNAAMNGLAKKLGLNHKNVDHEYPNGESGKTRYYRVAK